MRLGWIACSPLLEPLVEAKRRARSNNLTDRWTRFVVVMMVPEGEPMLTLVTDDEWEARRDRRAPRP